MSTDVLVRATPEMIHHWVWLLVFGIILLLLGIVAIARSRTATVVSMVFFGWLLLFAGCTELVVAFMVGHWAGFFTHLLIAILFGVTGALMVFRPTISAEAVTLVMSVFFLIGGIFQLFASFWTRVPGWGWEALNGAVSGILGLLLLSQWPISGLWVIGLFVGINLIFYGWGFSALALNLRKM